MEELLEELQKRVENLEKPVTPSSKEGRLLVHYSEGDLNQELDKAIEEALKPFGYILVGSGMDLREWVRDIEFIKKG
jgi:hypothetical protein